MTRICLRGKNARLAAESSGALAGPSLGPGLSEVEWQGPSPAVQAGERGSLQPQMLLPLVRCPVTYAVPVHDIRGNGAEVHLMHMEPHVMHVRSVVLDTALPVLP